MTRFADHLMIAPVVLPLFAGAMMLALGGEQRRNVNAVLNVVSHLRARGDCNRIAPGCRRGPDRRGGRVPAG